MSEPSEKETGEDVSRGPAAVMLLFSSWLAMPTLWFAWHHDRYSRGGLWAFGLWLMVLGYLLYRGRGEKSPTTSWWVLGAVACCSLGGIFSVNLFYHWGLAFSCVAFFQPYRRAIIYLPLAVAWMPATGWLASRAMAGGFLGWERPLTVLVMLGFVFLVGRGLGAKKAA